MRSGVTGYATLTGGDGSYFAVGWSGWEIHMVVMLIMNIIKNKQVI